MLLLLVPLAARAEEPQPDRFERGAHFALGLGTGVAYGTLGLHAELIYGHFAPFLGAGLDVHSLVGICLAAGARIFLGSGEGPMLSLNFASSNGGHAGDAYTLEGDYVDDRFIGASIGWRFRGKSGFYGEVGLGVSALHSQKHGYGPSPGSWNPCGTPAQAYSCASDSAFPDVNLALGFEF